MNGLHRTSNLLTNITGIGKAVAIGLAQAGCSKIILADIQSEELPDIANACRTVSEKQIRSLIVPCDIRDPVSVDDMIAAGIKEFGKIQYCANCAGVITSPRPNKESSVEDFTEAARINQRGVCFPMFGQTGEIEG